MVACGRCAVKDEGERYVKRNVRLQANKQRSQSNPNPVKSRRSVQQNAKSEGRYRKKSGKK